MDARSLTSQFRVNLHRAAYLPNDCTRVRLSTKFISLKRHRVIHDNNRGKNYKLKFN